MVENNFKNFINYNSIEIKNTVFYYKLPTLYNTRVQYTYILRLSKCLTVSILLVMYVSTRIQWFQIPDLVQDIFLRNI